MRVQPSGTPPQFVAELGGVFGGAWSLNSTIIIGTSRGLVEVPDTGGAPSLLTPGSGVRSEFDGYPSFLPDGRRFLYFRFSADPELTGIYLGSLDTDPEEQSVERILVSQSAAVFVTAPDASNATDGYVLYERDNLSIARRFDASEMVIDAEEIFVAQGLPTGSWNFVGHRYSASTTGVLAYRTGGVDLGRSQLLWFDREGNQIGQIGEPDAYPSVQLSPDGDYVTVIIDDSTGGSHAWLGEVARNVFSRINPTEDGVERAAITSTDGLVALTIMGVGKLGDIYAGFLGESTPNLWVENPLEKHPNDFSPDGRFLIYDEHQPGHQDLWVVPIGENGEAGEPIPFLTTPANESFGQFSPDGQWIAYHSDDSGRLGACRE